MTAGGTSILMSGTYTAITGKDPVGSVRPFVHEFFDCTLFECTSKWPARVFPGRVFSVPVTALGIHKIRKVNASYLVLTVDTVVSDVVSTLRTRII